MNSEKCGICHQDEAKYKCPKCAVRYCSLSCYKDVDKHKDPEDKPQEPSIEVKGNEDKKSLKDDIPILRTPELNNIYENNRPLRELLQYNTVKFHLAKVYRILNNDVTDTTDTSSNMNSEMKKQLAIDYLNTLRYGGIHYNEAIEEFCQICLTEIGKQGLANV